MASSVGSRSSVPAAWRRRRSQARWSVDWLGTAGWVEKGLLYLLLTLSVVLVAFAGPAAPGEVVVHQGALLGLALQSGGNLLLALVAFGLFAFAAYRLVTIAFDDAEGTDRLRRAGVRVASAAVYVVAGLQCVAILVAADAVSDGQPIPDSWSHQLLGTSSGQTPLIFAALGLVAFAGFQFYVAFTKQFMDQLSCPAGAASSETAVSLMGTIGIAARAALAVLVAVFFIHGVVRHDTVGVEGLDQVLGDIQRAALGPALLALVAVALAAYGLFCLLSARWRSHTDG